MSKKIERSVAQHPKLEQWLDTHHARHLWSVDGDAHSPTVQGWRVGQGVAIVLLYPDMPSGASGGWGIASEPNTNDIEQTFRDVEIRLGVVAPCGHTLPTVEVR